MRTKIIAEIAQAHDGSLGILHSYIEALSETGIDAIKFQTHIAEAESSIFEPFRVNFSYEDKTRFDYWKRMEFTLDQWKTIKAHCVEKNLEFMSSPFSLKSVDWLEEVGVNRYKIGSGEVSNLLLLDRISKTRKPVILSSGLSDWSELDLAVNFLKNRGTSYSILQCTTAYPTPPEKWGLNIIEEIKNRYGVSAGFSDHSGGTTACLAAVVMGADIVEFHTVFDRRMFGPDASSSLHIDEVKSLVKSIRQFEIAKANPIKKEISSTLSQLKVMFGKSLAVNIDLKAGETIQLKYLESKKPADRGILASQFEEVLGRKLKVSKSKWDFLKEEDLE